MASLSSKWVLITGASSGFGEAAAHAFAREGAKLLLGAPDAQVCALDVASTPSVEAFAAFVKQHTDKLDVLINNAGGAKGIDTVANGKDADWEFMMQTNVLGVLRVTRALLPLLVSNPGSSIINIGSIASRTAYEGGSAYCGAKAAELQITRALRLEMFGTGVRVSSVDPGLAETEFSLVRFDGDAERAKKIYDGVYPLTAPDIGETLVWVASRPPHVCIDELVIKCTDQAAIYKLYRRTK